MAYKKVVVSVVSKDDNWTTEAHMNDREIQTLKKRTADYVAACQDRRVKGVQAAKERDRQRALKLAREAGITPEDLAEVNEGL